MRDGGSVLAKVEDVLSAIAAVRVGVIGDFALDVYFDLDRETGETSVETGKPVHYGSGLVTHLGGASNVVNNLHALGVREICAFGATGDDILGHELLRSFSLLGVDTDHFFVDAKLASCAYVKPFVEREEASRIDFGTAAGASAELKDRILEALTHRTSDLDVVILNQQFVHPLLDTVSIKRLNSVIAQRPEILFCADLRGNGQLLRGATLKVNASETAEILAIDAFDQDDTPACVEAATRGERTDRRSGVVNPRCKRVDLRRCRSSHLHVGHLPDRRARHRRCRRQRSECLHRLHGGRRRAGGCSGGS